MIKIVATSIGLQAARRWRLRYNFNRFNKRGYPRCKRQCMSSYMAMLLKLPYMLPVENN